MRFTTREKLLLWIGPPIVILAIYGWFFLSPRLDQQRRLQDQLKKAQSEAPSPERLNSQRLELVSVQNELTRYQSNLKALKEQWETLAGQCAKPGKRNERVERLTGLLHKHNLKCLDDTEAENHKDGKLATALEPLVKQLATMAGEQKPQLRRIRFVGSYTDVHQALRELSQGDVWRFPFHSP